MSMIEEIKKSRQVFNTFTRKLYTSLKEIPKINYHVQSSLTNSQSVGHVGHL